MAETVNPREISLQNSRGMRLTTVATQESSHFVPVEVAAAVHVALRKEVFDHTDLHRVREVSRAKGTERSPCSRERLGLRCPGGRR